MRACSLQASAQNTVSPARRTWRAPEEFSRHQSAGQQVHPLARRASRRSPGSVRRARPPVRTVGPLPASQGSRRAPRTPASSIAASAKSIANAASSSALSARCCAFFTLPSARFASMSSRIFATCTFHERCKSFHGTEIRPLRSSAARRSLSAWRQGKRAEMTRNARRGPGCPALRGTEAALPRRFQRAEAVPVARIKERRPAARSVVRQAVRSQIPLLVPCASDYALWLPMTMRLPR